MPKKSLARKKSGRSGEKKAAVPGGVLESTLLPERGVDTEEKGALGRKVTKPAGGVLEIMAAISVATWEAFWSDGYIDDKQYCCRMPSAWDSAAANRPGEITIYLSSFRKGLRLPINPFFVDVLRTYEVPLSNVAPNGWRMLSAFAFFCHEMGMPPSVELFGLMHQLHVAMGYWASFAVKKGLKYYAGSPPDSRFWKQQFVFVTRIGDPWPEWEGTFRGVTNSGGPHSFEERFVARWRKVKPNRRAKLDITRVSSKELRVVNSVEWPALDVHAVLENVRRESELGDLPSPQLEAPDADAPDRGASEMEEAGGIAPARPLKRLRRGSRVIIQDVDEEVIQRRGSEAVPALGGEAVTSCGEPGRQGSGAGASSVKMKGLVDPSLRVPPIIEEVDEEFRQALLASQLSFAEEECRRGRRLKRRAGEGCSEGPRVAPEEEAFGVGELAGAEAAVVREGENPSDRVVGDASADAPSLAVGVAVAMQGEGTPAGPIVSFLSLCPRLFYRVLTCIVFCRYGGRASYLYSPGASSEGSCRKAEDRRDPRFTIEETRWCATGFSRGARVCPRAAFCAVCPGDHSRESALGPPGVPASVRCDLAGGCLRICCATAGCRKRKSPRRFPFFSSARYFLVPAS
jgi:hypothetical protein